MSDAELATLVAQLVELLHELRDETRGIIARAEAVAESAHATSTQNEGVFRRFLDLAKRQDDKCSEHRVRMDALERRVERLEEAKGVL